MPSPTHALRRRQPTVEGEQSSDAETDSDMSEGEPGEEGDASNAPVRPNRPQADTPASVDYKAFTTRFDEEIAAPDLCDAEELGRLRQQLDQQLQHLQGVVSKLANRLQRTLMAQHRFSNLPDAWWHFAQQGSSPVSVAAR